jgi:inner membrane protein
MDNLTHTLTGLALSQAGLSRWYTRPALLLMLAANIPDIDIVNIAGGPFNYFLAHRGITHAITMAPVMALLPVLFVCAVSRTMHGWKAAYILSIIGVASHLLLDWTNSYGVRFLFPFSSQWFRLDLNSLTDLWIWGVLILAFLGPVLGRLVSSEIGAKPSAGRGLALFALAFIPVYDFGRYLIHQRALDTLNSRVYQGGPPARVAAFPVSPGDPFEWAGWVERPEFVMRFSMNLLTEFDPTGGAVIYKPEPTPALDAARQTFIVRKFLEFAQYPLWQVTPTADPEGARRIDVRDWRFSFTASATVDASNRVLSTSFHY